MLDTALLLKGFSIVNAMDLFIVITGIIIGNIVFNNFEKHLPIYRRFFKHFILFCVLFTIGVLFGRVMFYSILLIMTIGQVILHAWYFPKHGINGFTAQPYEDYLQLIKKMKNKH